MASSISSLGIGSGVLTADVIDQLKEADTSRIIKPIENKVTINNQKQDAYELLSSLMSSFKASASALSYSTIFDNKSVDVSGEATVEVDAGATVESFTLETISLAKKDITQFGAVTNKEVSIATVDGTMTLDIGSKNYDIAYTAGMSLSDLAQAITDKAGDDISASILQTGDNEYSLVLASKETGTDSAIAISDSSNGTNTFFSNHQKIQTATDAEFKYNGITMTRATNEISDLILGVNIKLKEEGDMASVNVTQDKDAITGEVQLFVDSYNTLMSNLSDMTVKDKETGAEGVFNGDSFIKSISRELTRTITAVTGGGESLMKYGVDLDRRGTMSFDKSVMETKLADDPNSVKEFFSGSIDDNGNKTVGIFQTIDEKLKSYTGYNKLLSNFETDLKEQGKNLSQSYTKAAKALDARYAIMTQRFIAYDAMISKLNSQFSSLQMMINAEANAK